MTTNVYDINTRLASPDETKRNSLDDRVRSLNAEAARLDIVDAPPIPAAARVRLNTLFSALARTEPNGRAA